MNNEPKKEEGEGPAKLRDVLEKYQDRLYSLIATMLSGHSQEIMDVLQETNVSALASVAAFHPERPFWPWLRAIAMRRVADFYRAADASRLTFDSEIIDQMAEVVEDSRFSRKLEQSDYLTALKACLQKMPPLKRDMLEERYAAGHPVSELSRKYHLSAASLSRMFYKLREALRACINRHVSRQKDGIDGAEPEPEERPLFDELVDRFLDGELSEDGRRAFFDDIRTSREHLEVYMAQAYLHFLLRCRRRALFPTDGAQTAAASSSKPLFRMSAVAASIAAVLLALFTVGKIWPGKEKSSQISNPKIPLAESPVPISRPAIGNLEGANGNRQTTMPHPVPETGKRETANGKGASELRIPKSETASGPIPAKGENMNKAKLAVAATAVATWTFAAVAANQAGAAEGVSSATFLDVRDGADAAALNFLDLRDSADASSNGVHTRTIDTSKPLGTVIMLM